MLQKGLQPIHYAAQEGHEDTVMMLVDDFDVKPDVVSFVRTIRMYVCTFEASNCFNTILRTYVYLFNSTY